MKEICSLETPSYRENAAMYVVFPFFLISYERKHMISPIFSKLSFAAVEDVFSRVGILDRFTKGQIRHLSAHISWQVSKLLKDNW